MHDSPYLKSSFEQTLGPLRICWKNLVLIWIKFWFQALRRALQEEHEDWSKFRASLKNFWRHFKDQDMYMSMCVCVVKTMKRRKMQDDLHAGTHAYVCNSVGLIVGSSTHVVAHACIGEDQEF